MKKFQNKYRIPSARLQSWDYGSDGYYFITICTSHMEHYFGEIRDGEMIHNELGKLADKYWEEIPLHFLFVELGNYVVMPNHVHGILIIDKPVTPTPPDEQTLHEQTLHEQTLHVGTRLIASLPSVEPSVVPSTVPTEKNERGGITGDKNPMFYENISRIVRWYKGVCTFECHKIQPNFRWQARFHDHIIRDAQSFENIQHYIETNPLNWGKDKFNNPTE